MVDGLGLAAYGVGQKVKQLGIVLDSGRRYCAVGSLANTGWQRADGHVANSPPVEATRL